MKQEVFIVFLISCAFTAAMVPRERRAVNTEDEEHNRSTKPPPSASTSSEPTEICAPHTPCAWAMYGPVTKMIEVNVPNNYCKCGPGLSCVANEDDTMVSTYVYRCRKPEESLHILLR